MSEVRPQPGDKVRVTYEGIACEAKDGWIKLDTGSVHAGLDSCTVEILERADDPSRDGIGTVATLDGVGVPFVKVRSNRWEGVGGGLSRHNDDMRGRKVTGAVPGTPAAQARDDAIDDFDRRCREKADRVEHPAEDGQR